MTMPSAQAYDPPAGIAQASLIETFQLADRGLPFDGRRLAIPWLETGHWMDRDMPVEFGQRRLPAGSADARDEQTSMTLIASILVLTVLTGSAALAAAADPAAAGAELIGTKAPG